MRSTEKNQRHRVYDIPGGHNQRLNCNRWYVFLHRAFSVCAFALAMLAFTEAHGQNSDEHIGTSQQKLAIDKSVKLWTSPGHIVPVCWATPGFDREKRIVRQAVMDTWEYYANINFSWSNCPPKGDEKLVRVGIAAVNSGAGGSAALGMNALTTAADPPAVNFGFSGDGKADEQRVEYVGVHEFGHILGFVHEQDLPGNPPEAPAHCKTIGLDPNGAPKTPYDPNSVMNYCNADGNNQGRLTDFDILGVRDTYGARPHSASSSVILLGDGHVWRFTGRSCQDNACPGWQLIDNDARIKHIAASYTKLFIRLTTGQIWVWDGHTPCTSTACPGWSLIDANTRSVQIAAAGERVFQLQVDGKIWQWDGKTVCATAACTGWTLVDNDTRINNITASGDRLFARQTTGQIWIWDGHTPCTSTACPGWSLIDANTRSVQIAAAGERVFQLQVDGKIWQWDGKTVCTTAACTGWTLVDNDTRIKAIAATPKKLFARQDTGQLWVWDGHTPCTSTACPGWSLIDANNRSGQIAAADDTLFQLHVDGNLWRWDGHTGCTPSACPGWTLINKDARTTAIEAFSIVNVPSRLSSGSQF